jgi:hypothetical protein
MLDLRTHIILNNEHFFMHFKKYAGRYNYDLRAVWVSIKISKKYAFLHAFFLKKYFLKNNTLAALPHTY